jgi:DNA-binding transcriptional LysR family regulator
MELRQLEAFVEAAHLGSISRAAKALYLTQPTLTQRIRLLEQELGEQLLVRSRRGVHPSAAGSLFLPRAEAALSALRSGEQEVRVLHEVAGGRVVLGVTPDVALYVAPAGIARFQREHPAVDVAMETAGSLPLAALVLTGRVEIALVNQPSHMAGLVEWCVYEERLLPVAAPSHPLSREQSVTLAQFAAAGFVAHRAGSNLRDRCLEMFSGGGVAPRIALQAHNTEVARRLILNGAGVGLLPELAVSEDLGLGRLVVLPLERAKLPTRGIWGLRREDEQATGGAKALLDAIVSDGLPRGARARRGPHPPKRPGQRPLGDNGA